MALISYEEFQKTDAYPAFAKQNSDVGYLKVQAFMADQAIPIPDVEILITKEIEGNIVVFFAGIRILVALSIILLYQHQQIRTMYRRRRFLNLKCTI